MTKFAKENFSYSAGWLYYEVDSAKRPSFVARFKYRGPFQKGVFLTQLIKNHTVEEYFGKLDAGKAPLEILRDADPVWYQKKLDAFVAKRA